MQRFFVGAIATLGLLVQACGSDSSFSGTSGKAANRAENKPQAADAQPEPKATKPAKPAKPEPKAEADTHDGATDPALTKPATPAIQPPPPAAVIPQGAVTKGSFTVWTTPADPQPFESYTITIEVKLPSNTTSYTAADLTGKVVGTDGYTQAMGDPGQDFQFLGATARLSLFVPGAVQDVRDTVEVRSTLLNETQSLSLSF